MRHSSLKPVAFRIGLGLAATLLLSLSNGKLLVPVAAWIAPILLIRLMRSQAVRPALLQGYAVSWVACCLQWKGVFPVSGPLFYALAGLLCLVPFTAYAVDRLVSPRLAGIPGTLVLPTAMVVGELTFARLGGFGSWGSLAYSQASFLPLAQMVAVTGMYGVTFLIAWTASLANLAIETRSPSRRLDRRAFALVVIVPAAVCLAGVARLLAPAAGIEPITIATISPRTDDDANYRLANAEATQSWLLSRSRDAARSGADLIVWPEGSFSIFADDEAARIGLAAAFAREDRVGLAMPYASRNGADDPRYANKMVLIDPTGMILWEYAKLRPVPGIEDLVIPGRGPIARAQLRLDDRAGLPPPSGVSPTMDVRTVDIAGMICFDADHPELMRQTRGADLLLVPSDDWPEIVGLHSAMIRMRAIEHGLPIVRATLHGESVGYDGRGRSLGSLRDDRPHPRTLMVSLRAGPERVFPAHVADAFGLLNAAGLVLLVGRGLRRNRSPGRP